MCIMCIAYFLHITQFYVTSMGIQPVAFGVSCNLNFQSQSPWSVFNGAWYKGPRALDHRLRFENGKKHTPNAIGCITCARFRASLHHVECVLLCCVCVCVCVLRLCVCVCVCVWKSNIYYIPCRCTMSNTCCFILWTLNELLFLTLTGVLHYVYIPCACLVFFFCLGFSLFGLGVRE